MILLSLFLFLTSFDWTDWRGPARDGVSRESGLPSRWSPAGENLAWRVPYGGRSTPIVMGDRVYLQNGSGQGETLQERVMCFKADTGKLLWEHRFNVYHSDVPPHRIGWASPVGDPSTGNVYVFGVGGTLLGLSQDGKLLWQRSLVEEFGLITTHGGRTVSPVMEGDLVIVSGLNSGWGEQARASHRFMAFDKTTGQTVWVTSTRGRPFDTTYAPPIAAEINETRLLIAGAGDGAVYALKPQTGELVWRYEMSKRGINTGVVLKGTMAIVSHSEENLDTSEMGVIAAIDASAQGDIGKEQTRWSVKGFLGGYSSPVVDGDRVYQIDNGSNLFAFDVASGKQLWMLNLGTIQKASPVLADGKLYVGTENGKFYILKPGPESCRILDEDQLGTETDHEPITASVAVSNGRIFLVSQRALYCISEQSGAARAAGSRPGQASQPASSASTRAARSGSQVAAAGEKTPPDTAVAVVQVVPTELVLKPGESVEFQARLFDAQARSLGVGKASWSLQQLQGAVSEDGRYAGSSDAVAQAGQVKAAVGNVSGAARVRVIPPLPWSEDFELLNPGTVPSHWINASGKFVVREMEGRKVLVKLADNPFTKRARLFMGPSDWSDYTIEVDVLATERRRQMGDAGVVAQRYSLLLFGNHQRLELQSWQPETSRTVSLPFPWKANTWYRMKLQTENDSGQTRVRGKVWPASEPEPSEWLIERIDPLPNRQGSPGLYADAPFEIFFDNLKVTSNP